jgi:hypothetical protein
MQSFLVLPSISCLFNHGFTHLFFLLHLARVSTIWQVSGSDSFARSQQFLQPRKPLIKSQAFINLTVQKPRSLEMPFYSEKGRGDAETYTVQTPCSDGYIDCPSGGTARIYSPLLGHHEDVYHLARCWKATHYVIRHNSRYVEVMHSFTHRSSAHKHDIELSIFLKTHIESLSEAG